VSCRSNALEAKESFQHELDDSILKGPWIEPRIAPI